MQLATILLLCNLGPLICVPIFKLVYQSYFADYPNLRINTKSGRYYIEITDLLTMNITIIKT